MSARGIYLIPALLFLAASMVDAAGGKEPLPAAATGVVSFTAGEVLLNGVPAESGDEVSRGATIRTGPGSYCEVIFGGKNIFRIEADSAAVIDIAYGKGAIELERGALAAVFDKLKVLGPGRGQFAVRAPTAVAGIRGTVFFIKAESPERTYVCACNGLLRLSEPAGKRLLSVKTKHHKANWFSSEGSRIRSKEAPLLYHDDYTMEALAAKIQVVIDWGEAEYYEEY